MKRITLYTIPFLLSALLFVLINYNYQHSDTTSNDTQIDVDVPFSQKKAFVKGELKNDSPNEFAKYHREIRTAFGSDKPNYGDNYQQNELQNALSNSFRRKKEDLNWESRGPGNVGGRSRGIIIDPDDPTANTWFVAAVGGGVWKTTNAGTTWTELTKGIGSLSASYMAMAPSNHDIIYLGTGEGFGNLDALGGQGIWKSIDRGANWTQLENTSSSAYGMINRIIVDPNNHDIVLAVTSNNSSLLKPGIFKSNDGGVNWVKKFDNSGMIQQIVHEPGNFSIQYATLSTGKVYKSIDAGETWTDSSNGISGANRIEMCISPVDNNVLYASTYNSDGGSSAYYSLNKGLIWTEINSDKDFLGGQGWYDNAIIADPYEKDVFYIGGVGIFKVTLVDGGPTAQVTTLVDNYGGVDKGTHVDNHDFAVMKLDDLTKKFRLVVTNDGGVCYSDDRGETFNQPINGFITSQFYGVDKRNGIDQYVGGMQDNSTYASPENPIAINNWSNIMGGDGFDVVWNYDDEKKIMFSAQYNFIVITHSGLEDINAETYFPSLDIGNSSSAFYTRLAQSKQFSDLVFAKGTSGVWKTTDFGKNWKLIKMPSGFNGVKSSGQLEVSLADPSIVWTGASLSGTGLDRFFVSTDMGESFGVIPVSDLAKSALSGFATHPSKKNTAYALFSSAGNPKILKTDDLGQTWVDISGISNGISSRGFPDVAVYDLLVMPYDEDVIWAATEIGIIETTDGGLNWNYANNGIPPASIFKILIVNDEVVVGTHGRGVWTVGLPELSSYEPPKVNLPPGLIADYRYFEGKQYADVKISARADFTAIKVYLNNELFAEYGPGTEGQVFTEEMEVSGLNNLIKVESISPENTLYSELNFSALTLKSPSETYSTDFENIVFLDDFYATGGDFSIKTPDLFTSKGLTTNHPYVANKDLIVSLNTPIIVSATNSIIKYRDIAIVETGEIGTAYPDEEFWDYVTIETSTDGSTWTNIVTPYDASKYSEWTNIYNIGGKPSETNYKDNTIDLIDYYSVGETILIRFRLHSDQAAVGWGWIIDDLYIQTTSLGIDDKTSLDLNIYPNPLSSLSQIELPEEYLSKEFNYQLVNMMGQNISEGSLKSYDSNIKVPFNVDELASGNYILTIQNDNYISNIKLTK